MKHHTARTLLILAGTLSLAQAAATAAPKPTPAAPAASASAPAAPAKPAPAAPAKPAATAPEQDINTKAASIAAKAIAFLQSKQDTTAGGWSVPAKGEQRPHLPAITALAVTGMAMDPLYPSDTKLSGSIDQGTKYILSMAKPDGGIYDAILPTYNTAISLSALARVKSDQAKAAIKPAQEFLKRSQWGNNDPVGVGGPGGKESPAPGNTIPPEHPFYGGIGYGNRGRPDLSNLAFALQGWHDSGLAVDDEAYKRALVFIQRCQMLPTDKNGKPVNDQPYAKGSKQGGFIYATAENDKTIGAGQSFAGNIEETMDDGSKVSKLRAYGSMTYAGFKSYLYAGLRPDDPRVVAAFDWCTNHWTLAENPGIGTDGYYYYLVMFARAMNAGGQNTITLKAPMEHRNALVAFLIPEAATADQIKAALAERLGTPPKGADGKPTGPEVGSVILVGSGATRRAVMYLTRDDQIPAAIAKLDNGTLRLGETTLKIERTEWLVDAPDGKNIDWRTALINRLAAMQRDDGSFTSIDDRWMENNPSLTTAYALVALQNARESLAKK